MNGDLRFGLLIEGEAVSAKAALAETKQGAKDMAAAINQLGDEAAQADTELAQLRAELGSLKTQTDALKASEAAAIAQMAAMGKEIDSLKARLGGARTGADGLAKGMSGANLFAIRNFGQQLSQVGQQGAVSGDYLRALLIQLPDMAIGFGTAGIAVGVLASALPAAISLVGSLISNSVSLEAALKAVEAAQTAYDRANRQSLTPMADLRKEFGDNAEEVRGLYDALRDLERLKFETAFAAQMAKVKSPLQDMASVLKDIDAFGTQGMAGQQNVQYLAETFGVTVDQARQLVDAWNAVSAATTELDKSAALDHFSSVAMSVRDATGQIPPKLADAAKSAAELAVQGYGLAEAMGQSAENARQQAAVDLATPIRDAVSEAQHLAGVINGVYSQVASMRSQTALAARESEIRLQYGKDTAGAAGALANARIDQLLGDARGQLPSGDYTMLAQSVNAQRDQIVQAAIAKAQQDAAYQTQFGKTAGASSKSVADLIAQLRAEGEAMRTLDPVAQEMLKYREQLKGATDAQREAVRQLIVQNGAEAASLKATQDVRQLFTDTADQALDGLLTKGQSFNDVIDNIAKSLLSATFQAAALGTGPLASLFGMQATPSQPGGALGWIATALFPGKAAGGMIYGPGSGTSDDVLIRASAGEMMMTARATAANRPVLEAMNAGMSLPGMIPGFAGGGPIVSPGAMGAPFVDARPIINIENRSGTPITARSEETIDSSGRRTTRLILADAVGDAMTARGGGARKVLQQGYGLRPQGAKR